MEGMSQRKIYSDYPTTHNRPYETHLKISLLLALKLLSEWWCKTLKIILVANAVPKQVKGNYFKIPVCVCACVHVYMCVCERELINFNKEQCFCPWDILNFKYD